jgi:hypothetical protein
MPILNTAETSTRIKADISRLTATEMRFPRRKTQKQKIKN